MTSNEQPAMEGLSKLPRKRWFGAVMRVDGRGRRLPTVGQTLLESLDTAT